MPTQFWDGTRWTNDPSEIAPPPPPPTPARDWIATLGMVIVLVAAALPFTSTSATAPELTLNPSDGRPGQTVTATGKGFATRIRLQLIFDGQTVDMPDVNVTGKGSFKVKFKVPKVKVGEYQVAAAEPIVSGRQVQTPPHQVRRARASRGPT